MGTDGTHLLSSTDNNVGFEVVKTSLYASNIKRHNHREISKSLSKITMHGEIKSSFSTKFPILIAEK